jgi:hypothetical protein
LRRRKRIRLEFQGNKGNGIMDINCLEFILSEKTKQMACADELLTKKLEIEIRMMKTIIKEYASA